MRLPPMKPKTSSPVPLLALVLTVSACGSNRVLNVPSPDWRDQVIYFVLTDRFRDGDPSNNDMGAGEFDPSQESHYSGGDLQGVIDGLDYIRDLGATAVWITPPVANQWWDERVSYGGYHGYWARHFKKVDEHYGTLETYRELSHQLHTRGMYLIQDVVVNHTGNFFYYDGPFDPNNVDQSFARNLSSVPTTAPEQAPFDLNDVTNPAHRESAIYNWTPSIVDIRDPVQEESYQLSDLDDLNTENPVVRRALLDSYAYWIREVGVDGFRVDTAKYVSHDFWREFFHVRRDDAPGINAVAEATGRDDFLSFGEVFESSSPFDDAGEKKVASYLGSEAEPEFPAVINFPLSFTLSEVFAGGKPTAQLAYRIEKHVDPALFRNPFITPTFIDNHDVVRFLSRGSVAGLKQALAVLFTLPGIPVLYQGTEQEFRVPRASMFAGGFGPEYDTNQDGIADRDHFDTNSELYRYIKALAAMRRGTPALTRGGLSVKASTTSGPGLLVYQREHAGTSAWIVFNTADEAILMSDFETGLPAGRVLELAFGVGVSGDMVIGSQGRITAELPARAVMVLVDRGASGDVPVPAVTLTITSDLGGVPYAQDITVTGTSTRPGVTFKLVIDSRLGDAMDVTPDAAGNWSASIPIGRFGAGIVEHTVTAYLPAAQVASPARAFRTQLDFGPVVAAQSDPVGDDTGPEQRYVYPLDPSYVRGQMDIEEIQVFTAGSNLKVQLKMNKMSTVWGPVQGFDHVSFNIYLDLPNRPGTSVLPLVNAQSPTGFAWNLASVVFGWGNSVYVSEGATANAWGATIRPAPAIDVDVVARTVSFTYDTRVLGQPASLAGTKIYVTTWDIDGISGAYRNLGAEADAYIIGGGNYGRDPLIMDDVTVIIPQ